MDKKLKRNIYIVGLLFILVFLYTLATEYLVFSNVTSINWAAVFILGFLYGVLLVNYQIIKLKTEITTLNSKIDLLLEKQK